MSNDAENRYDGPVRGQILFAIGFFLLSAFLLSQIYNQTDWKDGKEFFSQPRFWPAVSLIGMVVFGLGHIYMLPRHRPQRSDRFEAIRWSRSLEWVGWFLAYVVLVPKLGYLPMSVAFAVAMAWRLGYRSPRMLWISAGFGVAVVVIFKMWLEVKIPGAAIYDYLPDGIRTFFIINF